MSDVIPELRRAIAVLREHGLREQADDLEETLNCFWTTSSEMAGELGLAIRRITLAASPLPSEVETAFVSAMREIRKVWPDL